MAIIPFNQSKFGPVTVAFQFNDANLHMTSVDITGASAGQVKVFIRDGVNPDIETSTGVSIAQFGNVQVITDELGTVYDFPVGMFVRVEYQSSPSAQQVNNK